MFKRILVPIDIAETAVAEPGVFVASGLAALIGGQVRLIHVAVEYPFDIRQLIPAQTRADRETAIGPLLQDIARKAKLPAEGMSYIVRTGVVYHEILAEAEAWGADLIIVGSHKPSMSTYLMGSNAQKIVSHANCPVLVSRPRHDEHRTYWFMPPIAS